MVIDTSVLIAFLNAEPEAGRIESVLVAATAARTASSGKACIRPG